ncbi:MAG: hypothetical protein RL340_944, partial [Gemmatimonadota bacterium]
MTERRQWALVIGISAALGVGLWAVTVRLGDELFPLKIGADAPDFAARSVAEATAPVRDVKGIDDYTGEVVLLNIWATWCGPCRVEMPSMQRLQERLGPQGLKIVAVSVDD